MTASCRNFSTSRHSQQDRNRNDDDRNNEDKEKENRKFYFIFYTNLLLSYYKCKD